MKHKGTVVALNDPDNLGRIRVKLNGFQSPNDITPWCFLCVPFNGFVFIPAIGDEVFVEQDHDGDWIYAGSLWSSRNPKPIEGTAAVRIIKTESGHILTLNDNGTLKITGKDGASITLNGSNIELNSGAYGVVDGGCVCAFSGNKHAQTSKNVKSGGPF